MSNHYRLVCMTHIGEESDEVGNNTAAHASMVMRNRENLIKAIELLMPLTIASTDIVHAHWSSDVMNAMAFVIKHPECEIELRDEYGSLVPFEDEKDPHDGGEDKFCSKCGGRFVSRNHKNLNIYAKVCINEGHLK